jgi:anti-sigma regulatory factor (Ser/Thr protein kinase)
MTRGRSRTAPHAPRATLSLSPTTENIPRARHFIDDALPDTCWADDVTLLVSELASNAVRHAQAPFTVSVGCDGEIVRVEVADDSPQMPVPRVPTFDAVTGRGLMIVEALATSWGVEPSGSGKTVWFEIDCRAKPGRD